MSETRARRKIREAVEQKGWTLIRLAALLQEWRDLANLPSGGIGGTLIERTDAALASRDTSPPANEEER